LRAALAKIPADESILAAKFGDSRMVWVNIGRALHRRGWDERGKAIWRDWSRGSPEFDEKGLNTQWASFGRTQDGAEEDKRITIGTIYWYAEAFERAPAFSEEAIAIDFANRHADRLRYVAKWNQWFCWDGTCWREDETRKVFSIARGLCRELALTMNKSSESKRIASAKTRAAVVSLAGEDYRLAATTDQWDADPWLLNTPDGAVDLRTGQMREHRTDDYMTKQTAVAPAGDCPRWKAFLDEVTAGDRELQAYLQGVSGYCLTGITREQQLYFMYGSGQNGKGVFVQTISGIMGDYHRATSIETFTVSQSERHPTELAALRGARLVTAAETEDGRRWAEARIKEMTGGDKIQARFMRQDFFEFFPQFKLIFSGNHMPTLRTINKAITRRFNRVPFAVTIVAEKMNLYLTEELRAEWPGILGWMIKGCLMWQRDGLKPPQAVTAATDQYLESQDAIGEWLKECCELAPGYWESTQELFTSWKPWAGERGEWIGSKNQFSQKLEDRGGFVPQRSEDRKHRGFRGLRLRRPSTIDELVDRWINECCEVGNDFWTDAVQASKSWQAFIKKEDGVSVAKDALRFRNDEIPEDRNRKLQWPADADRYAAACIDLAIAAVDEAERAALEAWLVREDANSSRCEPQKSEAMA
jgi:putative DNA primase/helicase